MGDDVAIALLIWAMGHILAVLCWFIGFLSLRFVDWARDRMAPVRAVCADCANGRKALPYGMRFSCFTDGDLHRR